jgi:hypothetical protein
MIATQHKPTQQLTALTRLVLEKPMLAKPENSMPFLKSEIFIVFIVLTPDPCAEPDKSNPVT